ncbi:MAG: hypothetical protein KDI36_16175 [Pseudomonadales bacterium]|nr:hypothetical protein [Pseudomonadales bacterium]
MDKLFSYFAGLLLAFALLALLVDMPMEERFAEIRADNGKYPWVYEQLTQDDELQIAIIGSSHTLNGVDDMLLSRLLNTKTQNLAVSYMGRDMQFLILSELLKHRKVSAIILEVDTFEGRLGHNYFGLVADFVDVQPLQPYLSLRVFDNLYNYFWIRTKKLFSYFRVSRDDKEATTWNSVSGFLPQEDQYDKATLLERSKQVNVKHNRLPESLEALEYSHPLYFLSKICELAKTSNTKIVFNYLPGFKAPSEPYRMAYYQRCGTVLLPSASLLSEPQYWSNVTHLNPVGAEKNTRELAIQILENRDMNQVLSTK